MALLYFVVLDAKIYRYRVKGPDHMLLLKLGVVLLSSEIGEDEKICLRLSVLLSVLSKTFTRYYVFGISRFLLLKRK